MVKRDIRRPPKRNIEQVGQQGNEPPPARRQRLSIVPTEAAGAAGTEETPAIDISTCCSGCMRCLPLSDFPRRSDGARARQCERCKEHPEQLGERDADGQDDGPPPASPRQETPAVDSVPSVPTQFCSGCKRTLPLSDFPLKNNGLRALGCARCKARRDSRRPPRGPQIGQENVAGQENTAPPPVRRARRSRAQMNADRATEERRRTANVEEALASALRAAEANAQRTRERADAARATEAEVEAARRAAADARKASRAAEDARKASRAAEDARRDATLRESMAAAARVGEANARQFREQAEAAWAASTTEYTKRDATLREYIAAVASATEAEVEAARRARRAAADVRKASRAAEDARKDATLRESMAAAARVNEANARQFREQAEAAWAASAAEYARRDAALRESMAATAVASQETSRAAVLHESLERR
ncbi:hypothetical protein E4U09_003168 [Claviceps aff. purpurea]|uniref:Uncharacterized protein n=1 Tax=Claviceps aff. purpurea TaxID=1967640 RepID=A0A9P7U5C7_9HYPO|nr:hypothetical protein E4U09_003168 [Claviceps aff. purpurea]